MTQELFRVNEKRIDEEITLNMLEDIAMFFDNGNEDEGCVTSQQHVGIREIFRGFAVKDWEGVNFYCEKFKELNKVLIVNAVLFCKECWDHRNECYNNAEKQRNRIVKWYEEVKENAEENETSQVKLFVRRSKINVEQCNADTIKTWICNVKKLIKKVEKSPIGDIRRHMES